MKAFATTTYGKWILSGEHAVLRGCPALAFPLLTRTLHLAYTPTGQPLQVEFTGENGAELKLLFYGVLENTLSRLAVSEPLRGHFVLNNALPVGAGLGASAALCGAVARWAQAQGFIADEAVYEFACRLEDLFHGESSGVDLAVSLAGEGVRFVRGGKPQPLRPLWWPRLYLSYCGQRGMTSECVGKVKRLFETDPLQAQTLDQKMRQAVDLCERALSQPPVGGAQLLRQGMDLGFECFQKWGLCQGDLGTHLQALMEAGAVAVKPTGSGGGGYALSLWHLDPPVVLQAVLVPVPQPNL